MSITRLLVPALLASILIPAASAQRHSGGPHGPTGKQPRDEVRLHDTIVVRTEFGDVGSGDWLETSSTNWVNLSLRTAPDDYMPQMASSFVAEEGATNVAMTFSAEARSNGSPLYVRALIDGTVADPSEVVFTDADFQGARSFTFTARVDAGIHSVEIQWRVANATTIAAVRGAALRIRDATPTAPGGTVAIRSAEASGSGTTIDQWIPVDDMTLSFYVPEESDVFVQFSAQMSVIGVDKSLWVRAKIDNSIIKPKDVVFARSSDEQSHTMVFGRKNVPQGWYTARIEWRVTSGGGATAGARSLAVSAFPDGTGLTQYFHAPPSGPLVTTTSTTFETVPGLQTWTVIPPNGEVSVFVSGEVFADGGNVVTFRARAADAISQEEVVLCDGGAGNLPTENQSFTFDLKHLNVGNGLQPVWVEWKVSSPAVAMGMGDRSMALVVEPGMMPDLGEGQAFGSGNNLIEPAMGTRKVLTILHDPHREGNGAPAVRPTVADIQNALYGPVDSMRDYFEVVSGGRFTLQDVGVLGWFDACKPWQHYWNVGGSHDCKCNNGGGFDDGFANGSIERYYEAIVMADPFVDYASYDTNGDGILDWQHELAILIVLPQTSEKGKIWNMLPFCPGEVLSTCGPGANTGTVSLDGVEIRVVASWATNLGAFFTPTTPTHELAHALLGLGDMYNDNVDTDTEPRRMSLMANNLNSSSYIDAMNRLALGWAEPRMIGADGGYQLEDVRTSDLVYVLPRFDGGDGREFYLLENRQTSGNDPLYDEQTGDNGIALWHVIEDLNTNLTAPVCMNQNTWANIVGGGTARRGIRLVRPHFMDAFGEELWNDEDYDVTDGGTVCPFNGDDWTLRRNALLWADGTASGYELSNWSVPAALMSFDVQVP